MTAPYLLTSSLAVYGAVSIVLGFFFGFFLERAGFSSARKLTAQFYFKDFAVLKVMFAAIVVAMLGIAYFALMGWLDMSQVFVTPTFIWPQLVGGLLLGAGFIIGGYCPGTSAVAAAIGRIDALFFVLGIFLGTLVFGEGVRYFDRFYLSGRRGALTLPQWLDWNTGIVAFLVVLAALGAFWISERSEGPWRVFARTYHKPASGKE